MNNSHRSVALFCSALLGDDCIEQIESAGIVLLVDDDDEATLPVHVYVVPCFGAVDVSCSSSHVRTNLLKGV